LSPQQHKEAPLNTLVRGGGIQHALEPHLANESKFPNRPGMDKAIVRLVLSHSIFGFELSDHFGFS
jgi:hypothetical protein